LATGPIWRSTNLFFMSAYEGLRQLFQGSSGGRTVPTALERSGDFSQSFNGDGNLARIYDPFSTKEVDDPANPGEKIWTREPFPGNKIPSTRFNSAGAKIAALYPDPNLPGEGPRRQRNYYKAGPGMIKNDKVEWRIDWAHNEKHRLFGRWSQRLRQTTDNPCFFCNGSDPDFDVTSPGWHMTLNDTLTPTRPGLSTSWSARASGRKTSLRRRWA
jgi:hypothetical protein